MWLRLLQQLRRLRFYVRQGLKPGATRTPVPGWCSGSVIFCCLFACLALSLFSGVALVEDLLERLQFERFCMLAPDQFHGRCYDSVRFCAFLLFLPERCK